MQACFFRGKDFFLPCNCHRTSHLEMRFEIAIELTIHASARMSLHAGSYWWLSGSSSSCCWWNIDSDKTGMEARFHFGHRALVLFPAIDPTAAGSGARERALLPFPCSVFCLAQFAILFIFLRPSLLLAAWPVIDSFFLAHFVASVVASGPSSQPSF